MVLVILGERLLEIRASVLASHAVYVAANSSSSRVMSLFGGVLVVSTSCTQDLIRSSRQLDALDPSGSDVPMCSDSLQAFSIVTEEWVLQHNNQLTQHEIWYKYCKTQLKQARGRWKILWNYVNLGGTSQSQLQHIQTSLRLDVCPHTTDMGEFLWSE